MYFLTTYLEEWVFKKKFRLAQAWWARAIKGQGVNNGEGIVEIGTGKGEEKDQQGKKEGIGDKQA